MEIKMDWVPGERIGPFLFGDSLKKYLGEYRLFEVPEEYDDDVGWHIYTSLEARNFRIYAEEGAIVGIACYSDCWYKGVNLIGRLVEEVVRLIGQQPCVDEDTIEIDGEEESIFEFDDVDAQVWVRRGRVASVICGVPESR